MEEARVQRSFPVKPKLKSKARTPKQTAESKYWSSFKTQQIPDLISVPSLTFSPTAPHSFAAAHSASLTLFSAQTLAPTATISSFSDAVSCASFRSDALLLAASDLSGLVQVFDAKSRTPLRRLRSHTRPCRFVHFPRLDKLHLISAADDALVKLWDVAEETPVAEFLGHKDYVRCGDSSPVNSDVFITGSYDHVVKLWDARVGDSKSSLQLNHAAPVEDVVFLPAGGMVATAGGNSVKLWDLIGGGKLVYSMESHNKTVTSICVGRVGRDFGEESNQFRIMSVGLDGYLKVFDYGALKVTHSMRFPAPLLSVGYSPDCSTRVIGTSNGVIYASKRRVKEIEKEKVSESSLFWRVAPLEHTEKKVLRPSHFRYFRRGQGEKPSEGDYLVMRPKRVKLAEHDKLLNKFRHGEALVSVLESKNPGNVLAVMEELVARRKLLKCVSNLDVEKLELLLAFLHRYCTTPRYSRLLMGLTKKVLEMRADDIRGSQALKNHVRNLKRSVEEEIRVQMSLQEIQGIISPLLKIAGR
ncbi:protein SLOW WALKER 1 [Cajanus cajan]|uniref:U3 small nucleolar RNA-associated protein 15 isogeny n=1 Tax=Cajanus cajan TaxID=3821 RepID=A0A151TWT8_CAJCA|nr:protein SLOW WALKER 1 [Cajanus cajan]KYP71515.1 U3 small nucleolar RNA-associated protein 15 isogeny [Cajanus cajan]